MEVLHFQGACRDEKFWIPSSWTGGYPNEQKLDQFYVYNTQSGKWETWSPMPEKRRRGSAAVALYNGKIYVAKGNRGGQGAQAPTLGWLDECDISTGS